jgi:UDP-hydrolysing UDP-N-acetyl-D-glucosamine 2-epimerase
VRTVGVVTVGRSDYGIYRPVLRALQRRDELRLELFVGGAHLLEQFGSTVKEIESDGVHITERVDFLLPDDSPLAVASSLGRGVVAFAEAFARATPDVLLVLGDRLEMLAAGLAALPMTIPVAHIHGGEATEGAIDDAARHALTKLSHLHFAATERAAERIAQLGEEPWRISVTGAPALDEIACFEPLSDEQLAQRGIVLRGPTLLVTFHPVTLEPQHADAQIAALLEAVADSGLDAIFTYPNADAGHRNVIDRIERLAATSDRYAVVRNLGTDAYFTLMARVVAMVGNSSSGIIEAASFRLPVVDVGSRQRGRPRADNVVHADPDAASIGAAIAQAASEDFRRGLADLVNPYGDGHAGERIAAVLSTVPLDDRLIVKRFHEVRGAP